MKFRRTKKKTLNSCISFKGTFALVQARIYGQLTEDPKKLRIWVNVEQTLDKNHYDTTVLSTCKNNIITFVIPTESKKNVPSFSHFEIIEGFYTASLNVNGKFICQIPMGLEVTRHG